MPLISIQASKKIDTNIRLEESTAKLVDHYAAFLSTKSADEVVDRALSYVFSKDKDFQQYLESHQEKDAPVVLRIRKPIPATASKKSGADSGAANGAGTHVSSSK